MKRLMRSIALSLLTLIFAAGQVASQEWQALPDRHEQLVIEGQVIDLLIRSQILPSDIEGGGMQLGVRSRVSLDDLQNKAGAILAASATAKSSCSTRWSFPRIDPPKIGAEKLIISGELRVEKWVCDDFLGDFEVGSQSATFSMSAEPTVVGNRATLTASLDDLNLGGLIGELGIDDELRRVLGQELADAMSGEGASFSFPEELAAANPRIVAVTIEPTGTGRGDLFIEATATISDAAALAQIIAQLLQ